MKHFKTLFENWELTCPVFFLVMPICRLQGLGHAILGNFSTDQIIIELT